MECSRQSNRSFVPSQADQAQLDLQRLLKRYVLRRKKEDVEDPDLQGKEEFVILCNMSPLQRRIYERLLQSADFQVELLFFSFLSS